MQRTYKFRNRCVSMVFIAQLFIAAKLETLQYPSLEDWLTGTSYHVIDADVKKTIEKMLYALQDCGIRD